MKDLFPLPYFFGTCARHQISSILFPLKLYSHGVGWEAHSRTERCFAQVGHIQNFIFIWLIKTVKLLNSADMAVHIQAASLIL